MAEKISWTYAVRADRGPTAALNGTLMADGYQKINVTVAAGAAQTVTIGPGTWADILSLVVSAADLTGAVTLTPDGAATALPLDAPFVLLGAGAVSLLGTGNATLSIANTGAADVAVDIFVARDATP